MSDFENKFNTLEEMCSSEGFDLFISDKLGNNLFIDDPERAKRMQEAAESCCDGSLHCEIIDDWREYLSSIEVLPDDWEDDWTCNPDECIIDAHTESRILAEINACEEWHIANGSYEKQVG